MNDLKKFVPTVFPEIIQDKIIREAISEIQQALMTVTEMLQTQDIGEGETNHNSSHSTASPRKDTIIYKILSNTIKVMSLSGGAMAGSVISYNGSYGVPADRADRSLVPRAVVDSSVGNGRFRVVTRGRCKVRYNGEAAPKNTILWLSDVPGEATSKMPEGGDGKFDCEIGWLEQDVSGSGVVWMFFQAPTIARYGF